MLLQTILLSLALPLFCPGLKVCWGEQSLKVWAESLVEGRSAAEKQGEDMGRGTQIIWMLVPACQGWTFHSLPSFLSLNFFQHKSPYHPTPGLSTTLCIPPTPLCGHSVVLQERAGPCTHHQGPGRPMSMAARPRQRHGKWAETSGVKSPLVHRVCYRGSRLKTLAFAWLTPNDYKNLSNFCKNLGNF